MTTDSEHDSRRMVCMLHQCRKSAMGREKPRQWSHKGSGSAGQANVASQAEVKSCREDVFDNIFKSVILA